MKIQSTLINLYECDKSLIADTKKIKQFIDQLCKEIEVEKYGKPLVKKFGQGNQEGYSAFQFIETSSITIHFDNFRNKAFIDICSCAPFNPRKAALFSKSFFKAKKAGQKTLIRK